MVQHRRESPGEWIFDSGTSSHMCREKAILKEAEEVSDSVIVANNMETPVVAKGNVVIKADLSDATEVLDVSEVLCIPELAMNLLSVHKICSRGHQVVFSKDVCEVFDQTGRIVAVGDQQGGLYRLRQTGRNVSCIATPKEDIGLWLK
ncbi:uncharacterized protein LOC115256752 [Aedes albopictus]|uniref:Retrovirus-related Pol polyprotein from transposon TNT 1-94-like beta-barrel domain-containing protein n=1 Tax=Aedes albopictus TaxID=7160 RepID=A0ABM1YU27_AEDAL|nr:uncharacterized protein LOC115256752 [Aedes albopictus]